jgi:hypothetical protein
MTGCKEAGFHHPPEVRRRGGSVSKLVVASRWRDREERAGFAASAYF